MTASATKTILTHPNKDEIMTQNSEMISARKTGAISFPNRYTVVFAIFWIIITAVLSIMLYSGFRGRSQVREIVVILGVISTSALILYLSQAGPSASELPDLDPLLFSNEIGSMPWERIMSSISYRFWQYSSSYRFGLI